MLLKTKYLLNHSARFWPTIFNFFCATCVGTVSQGTKTHMNWISHVHWIICGDYNGLFKYGKARVFLNMQISVSMHLNHRKDSFTQKITIWRQKTVFLLIAHNHLPVKVSGITSDNVKFSKIYPFLKNLYFTFKIWAVPCMFSSALHLQATCMISRQGWSMGCVEQEQISESEILCGYMSMITHKPDITHSRNMCIKCHIFLQCEASKWGICDCLVGAPT